MWLTCTSMQTSREDGRPFFVHVIYPQCCDQPIDYGWPINHPSLVNFIHHTDTQGHLPKKAQPLCSLTVGLSTLTHPERVVLKSLTTQRPWSGPERSVGVIWRSYIHFHASPISGSVCCYNPCRPLGAIVIHLSECWAEELPWQQSSLVSLRLLGSNHWQAGTQTKIWCIELPLASRGDPRSWLQIWGKVWGGAAWSPLPHSHVRREVECSLLFPSSPVSTLFSYPACCPLLLSVWLHTASDTHRSVAEAEL